MTDKPNPPRLSIIIPVLDEHEEMDLALRSLREARANAPDCEVIIVDGGSTDGSFADVSEKEDLRVHNSKSGRAHQMNIGSSFAKSPWLLFLHLDSYLEPDSLATLLERIESEDARPESEPRALPPQPWGVFVRFLRREIKQKTAPDSRTLFVFKLGYRNPNSVYRRMERGVVWRCENLFLPYGDQGFCMSRELYEEMHGFDESVPMEDLDFVLRLREVGRMELLDSRVMTSSRQYENQGRRTGITRNILHLIGGIIFHFVSGRHLFGRERSDFANERIRKSSPQG